jgi:hypothetical protein
MNAFADAFARIAVGIVLQTLAFVVWNIGSRTPLGVLRDARRSLSDARSFFAGAVAAAIGIVFSVAAAVLVLPALVDPPRTFVPVEMLLVVPALVLDYLIGDDLRRLAGGR